MLANFWEVTFQYLPYILIPLINAVVGWSTNWLALKMTFYPLDFVGIPPYAGWQGIIPSKAKDMAEKSVDLLTEKLRSIKSESAKNTSSLGERVCTNARLRPSIEEANKS